MAILLFAFWQAETGNRFFRSPDFRRLKADLVLYGIRYRRDTKAKGSQWVVRAETARLYEKKRTCEFDKVDILFLPHSKDSLRVVANKGLYDLDKGDLKVSGHVIVSGYRGYVLYSEKLFYHPDTMTIEVPGRAELVGTGGNRLLGTSMVYYMKEGRLTLASPRAVLSDEESAID